MFGALSTIIIWLSNTSEWFYNLVTYVVEQVGYIGGFAYSMWKLCFNILPVPLQLVGGICGGIMIARLVVSLGRR